MNKHPFHWKAIRCGLVARICRSHVKTIHQSADKAGVRFPASEELTFTYSFDLFLIPKRPEMIGAVRFSSGCPSDREFCMPVRSGWESGRGGKTGPLDEWDREAIFLFCFSSAFLHPNPPIQMDLIPHILQLDGVLQSLRQSKPP
jgi:hypothetical protein